MDKLVQPAFQFYQMKGGERLAKAHKAGEYISVDSGGLELLTTAYEREYMLKAKACTFMRRIYTEEYISRSKDGKRMYLSDFGQLGPRWVRSMDKYRIDHTGWYCDDFGTLIKGFVLCFTRHGNGEHEEYCGESCGKGKHIFMAGIMRSDWDGITLDLDTTDDPYTAARWADRMAEDEAESIRQADEEYRAEQASL